MHISHHTCILWSLLKVTLWLHTLIVTKWKTSDWFLQHSRKRHPTERTPLISPSNAHGGSHQLWLSESSSLPFVRMAVSGRRNNQDGGRARLWIVEQSLIFQWLPCMWTSWTGNGASLGQRHQWRWMQPSCWVGTARCYLHTTPWLHVSKWCVDGVWMYSRMWKPRTTGYNARGHLLQMLFQFIFQLLSFAHYWCSPLSIYQSLTYCTCETLKRILDFYFIFLPIFIKSSFTQFFPEDRKLREPQCISGSRTNRTFHPFELV